MMRDHRSGRRLGLGLVLPLLLVGGCPFDTGPPLPTENRTCKAGAPPPGGEGVELGQEVDGSFVPFSDGQALPIYVGPQGGQHVYTSVRLFATKDGDWSYQLRLVDSAMVERGGNLGGTFACGGAFSLDYNLRVFLEERSPISSATLSIEAAPASDPMAPRLRAQARVQVVVP